MIAMDLVFDHLSSPWRIIPLPSPGIVPLHVVPRHSEIVTACAAGKIDVVRRLFAAGHASPYDVTPDNLSLLYVGVP